MKTTTSNLLKRIAIRSQSHAATLAEASATETRVMLSIPFVNPATDSVFADPHLGQPVDPSVPAPKATSTPAANDVVQVNVLESGWLQSFVQNRRQSFLQVAGGSLFWRLFVGSGFAVLVGALTLIALGPDEQNTVINSDSIRQQFDGSASSETEVANQASPRSGIELTVSTQEGPAGQIPAEFDDPFVAENLVHPKAVHAVHVTDEADRPTSGILQHVSHRPSRDTNPAWLSGTIEEAADSPQSMRNYERSRPSHR